MATNGKGIGATNGHEDDNFDDMDEFYDFYNSTVDQVNGTTGNYTKGDDDDIVEEWVIVLIVLGVLFIVLSLLLVILFLYKYKSKSRVLPTPDGELGSRQEPINYLTNEAAKGKSYRPARNDRHLANGSGGTGTVDDDDNSDVETPPPAKVKKQQTRKKTKIPSAESNKTKKKKKMTAVTEDTGMPASTPQLQTEDTIKASDITTGEVKKKKKKKSKKEVKYASDAIDDNDNGVVVTESEGKPSSLKAPTKPLPPIKSGRKV